MHYRRMPIEIESPEAIGYGRIRYNLAESSVTDAVLGNLDLALKDVVLEYGLIGFILYISFFSIVLTSIYKGIKKADDKHSELHLVGRVLLATLVAILLTITTVSSILIIPVVYWAFAGLGIAFSQLKKVQSAAEVTTHEVLPTYRLATKT